MNYYERKAAGICARCSNPVTKGVYCDSCKARNKAEKRKLYDEKRENYDCVKCGMPTFGKAHCEECLRINRVKQKQRYDNQTEEQREKKYLYNRMWLAEHPEKKILYQERARERNRRYDNV